MTRFPLSVLALLIAGLPTFSSPDHAHTGPAHGDIPIAIRKTLKGRVVATTVFTDKLGTHSLVLTRDSSKSPDGSGKVTLQARQYVTAAPKWKLEWTINDKLICHGLDSDADFILQLVSVSDLDSNGIKETTVAYHLACLGGLDPKPTKAILRQGKSKYAVRGESLVKTDGGIPSGGTFTPDSSLEKAPAFKEHLISTWKRAAGF